MKPTLATVTLTLVAEDSTPTKATRLLSARIDSLRRSLRAVAISPDSVALGSRWQWWGGRLEVVPHQHSVPAADPRFGQVLVVDTTYRARDVLEVRVHDPDKIGAVFDAALALRVTDISEVRYSSTDTRAVEDEALQDATARAQRQAQLMAAASGGRLGRVITLSTAPEAIGRASDFTQLMPQSPAPNNRAPGGLAPPTIDILVTVYGRWQLLPRP